MGRLFPLFPNILLGCKKLTAYYATWNNYGHIKVFTKERGLYYITLWIRNEREMDCGLYYKPVTIVIYDRNDIGLYYKTRDDRN
jgi:hypothetical protein